MKGSGRSRKGSGGQELNNSVVVAALTEEDEVVVDELEDEVLRHQRVLDLRHQRDDATLSNPPCTPSLWLRHQRDDATLSDPPCTPSLWLRAHLALRPVVLPARQLAGERVEYLAVDACVTRNSN